MAVADNANGTPAEDVDVDELAEEDRLDYRAATQFLTVLGDQGRVRDAPGQFLVTSESGSEYLVDARVHACECRDHEFRGHLRPCKHRRRVAFARGAEPIPDWIDPDDVDPQLGMHVDGKPRWE